MLRTVGYSAGSALSATILQAHTPVGQALPHGSGYDAATVVGCGVWVVTAVVSFGLPRAQLRAELATAAFAGIVLGRGSGVFDPLTHASAEDLEELSGALLDGLRSPRAAGS